jgi:hypothetical protein
MRRVVKRRRPWAVSHPARLLAGAVAFGAGVVSGGCGGEDPGPRTAVRDSAGVRIVENEAPDPTRLPAWSLSAEPSLDIGRLEGTEVEALFRVVSAVRLADGRVAVANAGTSEVRYYGPDGRHRVSSGGEGGGPGEFQRIASLVVLPADSLAVVDPFARRLSVLDPDGTFAREVPTAVDGSLLTVVGRRPDGTWVASLNVTMSGEQLREGPMRADLIFVTLAPGGGVGDTVGRFPGADRFIHVRGTGGRVTSIDVTTPPFARTTRVLASGDELWVATQDAAQVEVYGPDGSLRRIHRTGVPLQPVTSDLVEAFLDRRYADLPPERRQPAREAAANLPAGEFVPPYGAVALARSGDLWIQDYPHLSDANRWTVYAADGAPLARVELPERFTPYDVGDDWILGRELDELDVEHVRIYGVRKTGPTP